MAIIATHESTANVPASRRVRDVQRGIAYVDPDENPLIAVTRGAKDGSKSCFNSKFEWIEKDMLPPRWDQVNGAMTTGDLTMTVDNGGYFTVGDLVKVGTTGEVVLVTSIATNALTVTRSFGDSSGTAAATIGDNVDVRIIGNAIKEGAAVGTPRSNEETYPYNFTQIFRTEFGATGSEMVSENYTGRDRVREAKEKAIEHAVDIEAAFIWGERAEDTSDTGGPRRATGGLLYFLTSNAKSSIGTLTEPELEDWAEDLFQRTGGKNTRLLLASPLWVSTLNQLAAGRQQVAPKEDTFGVHITRWVTGHGDFLIAKHRLLVDGTNGDGYAGHAIAVDPSRLKYRYLRERDTKLLKDRQAPGDDKFTDEYLSECGLQVENPIYGGVGSGLTG